MSTTIYDYLKKDHRKVSDLMKKLCNEQNPSTRKQLYATIRNELIIHADAEEKSFYEELEEKGGKQLQEKEEHAEEEHDEIRKYIREIDSANEEYAWLIAFGKLMHSVEHHVKEEEEEIFSKAKKVISDKRAVELAEEMEALKASVAVEKKIA